MIRGITILLVCQLIGEALARGLALPVPGPVLGLAILVAGMAGWNRWQKLDEAALTASGLGQAADGLLAALALLFVPAGVGVVQHLALIGQYGLALGLALAGSTLLTLLITVGVFLLVKRITGGAAR
jgi:putative effector of murein hydrolase LrgA (UPF0299 family)